MFITINTPRLSSLFLVSVSTSQSLFFLFELYELSLIPSFFNLFAFDHTTSHHRYGSQQPTNIYNHDKQRKIKSTTIFTIKMTFLGDHAPWQGNKVTGPLEYQHISHPMTVTPRIRVAACCSPCPHGALFSQPKKTPSFVMQCVQHA